MYISLEIGTLQHENDNIITCYVFSISYHFSRFHKNKDMTIQTTIFNLI